MSAELPPIHIDRSDIDAVLALIRTRAPGDAAMLGRCVGACGEFMTMVKADVSGDWLRCWSEEREGALIIHVVAGPKLLDIAMTRDAVVLR